MIDARVCAALAAFAAMAVLPSCTRAEKPIATVVESGLRVVPVTLAMARGRHVISAEVAVTMEEQAKGLMDRDSLAADAGMLFPFSPPRPASFWMKNTRIPLDIVFIRADGTVIRVAEKATPYSLAPIDSGEPAAAVLELVGGRAAALGLKPGDRITWPAL